MLSRIEQQTRRFDRRAASRNLIECLAGAAVTVFFAVSAIRATAELERAGEIVVASSAARIVFYLIRYGQGPAGAGATADHAGNEQTLAARYHYQVRLLKSVKYWYLLPFYVGLLIATAGVTVARMGIGGASWPHDEGAGLLGAIPTLIAGLSRLGWRDLTGPASYTAVFGFIWWLNEVNGVRRLRKERARLAVAPCSNR